MTSFLSTIHRFRIIHSIQYFKAGIMSKIVYTLTDEAPFLATHSLLPMLQTFFKPYGIEFEIADISLATRIKNAAAIPQNPTNSKRDDLQYLADLVGRPDSVIMKLPNISASASQLKDCISELREQGYNLPLYPESPQTQQEHSIRSQYQRVMGSAVNPVLRDGNSDRRIPAAVKQYTQAHPHRLGEWKSTSQSHVSSMDSGDFYGSEKSYTTQDEMCVKIIFVPDNPHHSPTVMRESIHIAKRDIIDAATMCYETLKDFFKKAEESAQKLGVIYSVHLKATMMKISDPHIFACAIETYFRDIWQEHGDYLESIGAYARYGLKDIFEKLDTIEDAKGKELVAAFNRKLQQEKLAMVDSERGISNFHVPSDIIIDASMAAMIRSGGKMWAQDGESYDCCTAIPDRSYAGIYDEAIKFFIEHGSMDPAKMGSLSNVGLMAHKAQEYGSHPYTFIAPEPGQYRVIDMKNDQTILSHQVRKKDIWRMCHTSDIAIRDWIRLTAERSRIASPSKTIFWLDDKKSHDHKLIQKIQEYLPKDANISIAAPRQAMRTSLEILSRGENVIASTGNVLRDYLTDLFPILEVGTSAKMLSVVSLLQGGGLFETGSGGSAPKHVQQLIAENHLRWDSLGEMLAIGEALGYLSRKDTKQSALLQSLANSVQQACSRYLEEKRYPSRICGELDTRGSHVYFMRYLAESCSKNIHNLPLQSHANKWVNALEESWDQILQELLDVQGSAVDLQGYYHPSSEALRRIMQPSSSLNQLLSQISDDLQDKNL